MSTPITIHLDPNTHAELTAQPAPPASPSPPTSATSPPPPPAKPYATASSKPATK